MKEPLLDDVPVGIKRSKAQTGPVERLAETPLLVESFA